MREYDLIAEWYAAEHTFTRDQGPRFDPEATDLAFAEMVGLFRRVFRNSER